jgi:chromate transporter
VKHERKESAGQVSLWFLFWTFIKVGSTTFGGFMALISVVQSMVVERKKLLKHEEMLDGISLATIIPGPVAVNVVAYVGYRLRGGLGAAVSVTAVILPSFFLLLGLSVAYFQWGQIPAVSKLFMGFLPAVTAIILAAAWNMSRKAVPGWRELAITAVAGVLLLVVGGFFITLGIICAAGLAGWILFRNDPRPGTPVVPMQGGDDPAKSNRKKRRRKPGKTIRVTAGSKVLGLSPLVAAPLLGFQAGVVAKLFIVFAGMSVMLFGGGYVFIPLIQEIVVDGQGWVSQKEFIDAIAMGQITPGPILISATFIGYKVAGLAGATAATAGIFLPPALLMIAASRVLDYIKKSIAIKAALRGVHPAVVGLIFAAAVVVARSAPHTWVSLAIFAAALLALLKWRIEVVWIIPAAGLIGTVLY